MAWGWVELPPLASRGCAKGHVVFECDWKSWATLALLDSERKFSSAGHRRSPGQRPQAFSCPFPSHRTVLPGMSKTGHV